MIADIARALVVSTGAGAKAVSDALLEEAVRQGARGALAVMAIRLDCDAEGSRRDRSSSRQHFFLGWAESYAHLTARGNSNTYYY